MWFLCLLEKAACMLDSADLLRTFGLHLESGNADGAAMLFAPDAVYAEPPRFQFAGREALRAFFADFLTRHTDVHFAITRTLASADDTLLAAEWRWSYTRTADGTARAFAGMCFVEISYGLITRWRGYSVETS